MSPNWCLCMRRATFDPPISYIRPPENCINCAIDGFSSVQITPKNPFISICWSFEGLKPHSGTRGANLGSPLYDYIRCISKLGAAGVLIPSGDALAAHVIGAPASSRRHRGRQELPQISFQLRGADRIAESSSTYGCPRVKGRSRPPPRRHFSAMIG